MIVDNFDVRRASLDWPFKADPPLERTDENACRKAACSVFVYGFAKSKRANVTPDRLVFWRRIAAVYLAMTEDGINAAVDDNELEEVMCDDEADQQ